jgi:transcriptional regulator of acetoin/glycerol metabolism
MAARRSGLVPVTTGPAALRSRWESFAAEGRLDPAVRPEIAASWQRAAAHHVATGQPAAPVDEAALRGFDHSGPARRQYVEAARGLCDELAAQLGDAPAAVVACDDFGVILHRAGRREVLRAVEPVGMVPGAMWGEKAIGTTGIGLALATGGPAHVDGAEHYLEALHAYNCTAAVVRHPVTREALGVLGMATGAGEVALLARPLVATAAREIERRLQDGVFGRERELMEQYLRRRAGEPAAFLTVDRAGHTVIQNARMLQGASSEDVALLLTVARQALDEDLDLDEPLELSRGRARVRVRLVHDGAERIGAVVSVQRPSRPSAHGGLGAARSLDFSPLVGRSPAMQQLFREASAVARHRLRVTIRGEPGTGKLTIARHLHALGGSGPLTIVHCAGGEAPRELAEAARRGGTAVLRRVHALSEDEQLALCDQLDELADTPPDRLWVMSLLSLSAPPPCAELDTRLSQVTLTVPTLRDRGHDLRLLVEHWCAQRERSTGIRPVLRPEALEALEAQPWPGNVRQLHNALDGASLRAGTVIGVEALALHDASESPAGTSLREIEREAIDAALRRTGGNVTRAARDLGIGRATLHRRLRAYRLLDD